MDKFSLSVGQSIRKFLFIGLICCLNYTHAHPSWGIAVDDERNIYFADILHHDRGSVWRLSSEGKLELLFQDFHAHNVSLDANYNLVTAHGEMDEHFMISLNKDGSIDTLFNTNDYKKFNGGCCAYSPKNEIVFSAEHYLWRLNKNGKREKLSDHYFEWNQTVYADDNGNYYGPDIADGKGKLIRIDSNGEASVIATDLITKLERPYDKHADVLMGITKGCDGYMYIAELAGQRIIKILEEGKTQDFYISEGDWVPTGIDFFSGDAYILEYKEKNGYAGPRIIKIDESGNKSEIFNYDEYEEGNAAPLIDKNKGPTNWWLYSFLVLLLLVITLGIFRLKNHRHSEVKAE
ncbi:MAG: hypothetical protein CMP59_09530 [Flavobacteriales bacterium]|nr:hypothetical protein [Flavobacteriales bacterium]